MLSSTFTRKWTCTETPQSVSSDKRNLTSHHFCSRFMWRLYHLIDYQSGVFLDARLSLGNSGEWHVLCYMESTVNAVIIQYSPQREQRPPPVSEHDGSSKHWVRFFSTLSSILSVCPLYCCDWGGRQAGRFLSWEVILCAGPLPSSHAYSTPLSLEGDLIWWLIVEFTNIFFFFSHLHHLIIILR